MRPGTANRHQQPQNNQHLPRVSTAPSKHNANNNNNLVGGVGSGAGAPSVTFAANPGSFEAFDFLNNTSASLDGTLNGERTPLSNAMENAAVAVKNCEANVTSLSERLVELQQNLIKSKQLENEIGPRETETKNAVAAFQRLVDVSTKIKKGAKKRSTADSHDENNDAHNNNNDDSESQISRSEAATTTNQDNSNRKDGGSRSRYGLNLLAGKDGDLSKEEIADRDAIRHLSHKIRHILTPVFAEIFFQDSTTRETQKATFLQQQAEEQAARESLLANAAAAGNEKSSRASRRVQQQLQQQQQALLQQQQQLFGGAGGKGGASGGGGAVNPLFDRLDPDLYLIPGIDPSFFQDLLNLRQTRLTAERALKKTQEQLSTAQSIVSKRRSDGSNKTALRKAERQLQQATAALRELHRQKEEKEIRKRLEAAATADGVGGGGVSQGGGGPFGGAGGPNALNVFGGAGTGNASSGSLKKGTSSHQRKR